MGISEASLCTRVGHGPLDMDSPQLLPCSLASLTGDIGVLFAPAVPSAIVRYAVLIYIAFLACPLHGGGICSHKESRRAEPAPVPGANSRLGDGEVSLAHLCSKPGGTREVLSGCRHSSHPDKPSREPVSPTCSSGRSSARRPCGSRCPRCWTGGCH